ncbi:hypothetical protein LCGC14_1044500 [marine sediment metagenome]|uniref:Uncharacterized protein n=1 Tax=marine sediment metagenome TaxID=412755 RepID=A0A0F9MQP6_9ZZZZ|nr:hypothetical protein [archaeon]
MVEKAKLINDLVNKLEGLDLILIESFAKLADELSEFQDKVSNEAYLETSRKRITSGINKLGRKIRKLKAKAPKISIEKRVNVRK